MHFQLAAIDIDDTLVGTDKQISEENQRAVSRLQRAGCRVVLASGREHRSMLLFHTALGLEDYVVSSQGALVIHSRDGHELWHRPVDAALATHLLDEGRRQGADVLLYTRDGIFVAHDSPWLDSTRMRVDATIHLQGADLDAIAAAGPLKVLWHAGHTIVARLAVAAHDTYRGRAEVVVTAPQLLEFNAPDATKATAIAAVANHYGVAQDRVVAFGDGLNDVALLRWAGCGVAVGHAAPEARAAANLVVADGDPNTSLARGIDWLFDDARAASLNEERPGAGGVGP